MLILLWYKIEDKHLLPKILQHLHLQIPHLLTPPKGLLILHLSMQAEIKEDQVTAPSQSPPASTDPGMLYNTSLVCVNNVSACVPKDHMEAMSDSK